MSDLPSTPPTKTPQSVAPTSAASGDTVSHQGTDRQTTRDNTQADPTRDVATASAVTFSASIAGLRAGATIHCVVGKPDAGGRPTLKSAPASFAILSESILKAGQSVVLEVVSTVPWLKATLITVDGRKPPGAQQLLLAITDVPPERLAERARIDTAIAYQTEIEDQAPVGRDSARGLFLGQTTAGANTSPPFQPGATLRVKIESIDPTGRDNEKRPSAQTQPVPTTVRSDTASQAIATDGTPRDKPVSSLEEPKLRLTLGDRSDTPPVTPSTSRTILADTSHRLETEQASRPPKIEAPLDPTVAPQLTSPTDANVARAPTVAGMQITAMYAVTRFNGTVLNSIVANRAIVQTPSGLFAIDAPAAVVPGAKVTFAVSAIVAGHETSAIVPHLNPSLAPAGLQTRAIVAGPAVITTAEAPEPAQLQPLPLGSQVVVKVLGSSILPTAPEVPNQGREAPTTPAEQPVASAHGQSRITHANVSQPMAFATESVAEHAKSANARPEMQVGLTTPQEQAKSKSEMGTGRPLPATPLPPLTGLVVGHSISGHAVVQTPVGLLTVDNLEAIPKDIAIQIEVRPQQTSRLEASLTPKSTLLTFGQEWQTLKEIVSVVAATDAVSARRFVNSSAPAMNNRLASSMIFFFLAMQGGVPRTWLGDAVSKALERAGRRDLIERLGSDFASMRRLSEERGPGDWRTFLFPFFDGKELQQLRMFARHGEEGEGNEDEGDRKRSLRFVVDVSLTKLGDLQFDGLVQGHRFDLIVRSKSGLADDMRQEISAIFSEGRESANFEGNIYFEKTPGFPVSPFDEVLRSTDGNQVRA